MFSTFLFALVGLSARLTDLLTGFKLYLIMWNEAGNPKYLNLSNALFHSADGVKSNTKEEGVSTVYFQFPRDLDL